MTIIHKNPFTIQLLNTKFLKIELSSTQCFQFWYKCRTKYEFRPSPDYRITNPNSNTIKTHLTSGTIPTKIRTNQSLLWYNTTSFRYHLDTNPHYFFLYKTIFYLCFKAIHIWPQAIGNTVQWISALTQNQVSFSTKPSTL